MNYNNNQTLNSVDPKFVIACTKKPIQGLLITDNFGLQNLTSLVSQRLLIFEDFAGFLNPYKFVPSFANLFI